MKSACSLLLLFIAVCGKARELSVCADCECTTIQSALAEAQDGDKITVRGGIYQEGNIVIEKEIELAGAGASIIDGANKHEIITVRANNVTLSNLRLQNSGSSYSRDIAAIKIERVKNCWVQRCNILNSYFGIYLSYSQGCVIRENVVQGSAVSELTSGNAIHIWNSRKITVENNKLSGHRDGIYLEVTDHCQVAGNYAEQNVRYGLHFMFSDNAVYKKNVFTKNQAGVAVMYSHDISMLANTFSYNWGASSYGLLLKEIKNGVIAGNNFYQNTTGIFAEDMDNMDILKNSFNKNGWALKIGGDCSGNVLCKNNFLSNTFELGTNARTNENCYEQNFWSQYSGYDLNRDGIGDVPHRPANLFTHLVQRQPESVLLMRSLFIDMLIIAEKVSPAFSPAALQDEKPRMQKI